MVPFQNNWIIASIDLGGREGGGGGGGGLNVPPKSPFIYFGLWKCKGGLVIDMYGVRYMECTNSLYWSFLYGWHTQPPQLWQELFLHAGRFEVRLIIIMILMVFKWCHNSCMAGWGLWWGWCLSQEGIFMALVELGRWVFFGIVIMDINHSLHKVLPWLI